MIEAKQLIKDYGRVRAVDRIDFKVEKGECVGLLGLNGAGKTTLLRMLSCLLAPTSGTIVIDGHDVVAEAEKVRLLIGYLPEEPPLYQEMKVGDFLAFVAQIRGVPYMDVGGRVQDVLRRCQLERVAEQRIETLSYGYRKRVGIAQAIVHNPQLVILDEPVAGLDPAQIVEMRELIRGLRGGHTVIVSSHILSEISQICDRLLVLHQGRLVGFGSEEELLGGAGREQVLEVEVKGKEEELGRVLGGVKGISSWKVVGREQGRLHLEALAAGGQEVRGELSRALVQGGFELLGLGRRRDQLEETFLKLTGGKEKAA